MVRRPKNIRVRRREQGGFTLIEAMLAMFVFVVGALGLLGLMYNSAAGMTTATSVTTATSLARAKLDELSSRPYDHTDLTTGDHLATSGKNFGPAGTTFDPQGVPTGDFGSPDGWFARSWVVTEVTANSFKTIAVEVRWYDKMAKTWRSVTLTGGKSIQ